MLNHLSALLFGNLINMPEKGQQGVQIEQLEDALAVLVDALDDDLVNLCIALT